MSKELIKKILDSDPKQAVSIITDQDPKTAFDLIFEHNDPPAVVQALPFEDAYLIVKGVGETDSVAILEMMEPDQIQGFFDLDCWEKDKLSLTRAQDWMAILMEFDDERFTLQIEKMDVYLQLALFKYFVEVIKIEEPDENPFYGVNNVFVTPDNRYALKFSGGDEPSRLSFEVLMRIYRLDLERFYWVMEGLYWETYSELEESAYQEKAGRLESQGFPDFYQALEIFSVVDPEKFVPKDKIVRPQMFDDDPEPSMYLQKAEAPDSLLRKALAHVTEGMDAIQVELMNLINMVVIGHQASFSDIPQVGRIAKLTDGYISLALDRISKGNLQAAAGLLTSKRLLDLYKIGRSLTIKQGRIFKALLPKICLDQQNIRSVLFDTPLAEFIEGMTRKDPVDYSDGKEPVPFATLKQLNEARERIDAIFALTKLLHDDFQFVPATLRQMRFVGTNQPNILSVSYTQLFCTCFANDLLMRPFAPVSVSQEDCLELVAMMENGLLPEGKRNAFFAWLDDQLGEADAMTRKFFEDMFALMASQLVTFAQDDYHDVRFLNCMIVNLPY